MDDIGKSQVLGTIGYNHDHEMLSDDWFLP